MPLRALDWLRKWFFLNLFQKSKNFIFAQKNWLFRNRFHLRNSSGERIGDWPEETVGLSFFLEF